MIPSSLFKDITKEKWCLAIMDEKCQPHFYWFVDAMSFMTLVELGRVLQWCLTYIHVREKLESPEAEAWDNSLVWSYSKRRKPIHDHRLKCFLSRKKARSYGHAKPCYCAYEIKMDDKHAYVVNCDQEGKK